MKNNSNMKYGGLSFEKKYRESKDECFNEMAEFSGRAIESTIKFYAEYYPDIFIKCYPIALNNSIKNIDEKRKEGG